MFPNKEENVYVLIAKLEDRIGKLEEEVRTLRFMLYAQPMATPVKVEYYKWVNDTNDA